ncbi:MAG: hypothetical protein U0105_01700 [Candidatus Obscuribacterales bacterium]
MMNFNITGTYDLDSTDTMYSLPPDKRSVPSLPPVPQQHFASNSELLAAALEESAPELPVLDELQRLTTTSHSSGQEIRRDDLAKILEGFARVLRGDAGTMDLVNEQVSGELASMKHLLVEAQETIIQLLNDRVYDRAKIARLEAENRLLPDLQAQASRAMGLAVQSEDFAKELNNVRTELERLRSLTIKDNQQENRSFLAKLLNR